MDNSHSPGGAKRLRCTIIGAGVSGIMIAYKLRKHLREYVDFHIYEKSPELGGTWYENRYPGCACDVPSHNYQFPFCPNPNWSKFYASSREINAYLKGVTNYFDLEKYITYNSQVTHAEWSEERSTWTTRFENSPSVESDILINASGILNNPQMPNLEGLSSFEGPLLHTAAWDDSVDLTGKRVVMIGAGASGIQVLPQIQPIAQKVNVFIRTPSWIFPPVGLPEGMSAEHVYNQEEKDMSRWDEETYLRIRKASENEFNNMYHAFLKTSQEQKDVRARIETRMRSIIKDPALQEKLIPNFEVGCRRVNPGEPFLHSLQKPNVEPVFAEIDMVTRDGVIAGNNFYPADVLIAATGFDTSFTPRFPILGAGGVNLQDIWADEATAYMGVGVSGFPNYLIFLGPNTPISNGSLMGSLEATADYFIRLLRKVSREHVKSFDVRADAQADFDLHTRTTMKDLVWTGSCRSWYKKGIDGKVTGLWPGSSIHYMQVLAEGRWEDYNWSYDRNRYAYFGHGESWVESPLCDPLGLDERECFMSSNTVPRKNSDLSFYLWKAPPLPEAYLQKIEETPKLQIAEETKGVVISSPEPEQTSMTNDKLNSSVSTAPVAGTCIC